MLRLKLPIDLCEAPGQRRAVAITSRARSPGNSQHLKARRSRCEAGRTSKSPASARQGQVLADTKSLASRAERVRSNRFGPGVTRREGRLQARCRTAPPNPSVLCSAPHRTAHLRLQRRSSPVRSVKEDVHLTLRAGC